MTTAQVQPAAASPGPPEPLGPDEAGGPAPFSLLRLGASVLVAALALFAIAVANSVARNQGGAVPEAIFYLGVAVAFAAFLPSLFAAHVSPAERTAAVACFVVALYLIKVLYEPASFGLHDELAQMRSTDELLRTGHLFSGNPVVRAYPYFPGVNAGTAVVMSVTHLSQFWSGTILIGLARLAGGLALYELFAVVTGSRRVGAIGVAVYATNPNFLYFDADYSYESLALPLAVCVLLCAALTARRMSRWPALALGVVLSVALAITHHISSYWLAVMLLVWLVVAVVRRRGMGESWRPARDVLPFALVSVVTVLAWQLGVAGSHTATEVEPAVSGAQALVDKLTGRSSGPSKQLFGSSTGQLTNPLWAQVLALAAVAFALVFVVWGLIVIWRRYEWRHPLVTVLCLLSILLPVTLALRLTQEGTETSNRASEFVYFGLALEAAAVFAVVKGSGASRHVLRKPRSPQLLAAFGLATVIMFLGGFIIGWAPYERQPGPYLGAAELRSSDPKSVQAARWADRLPRHSFIAADLSNGLLMAAYASLNPQNGSVDGKVVSALFYSSTVDATDRAIISADKIKYVVVDLRTARYAPQSKGYFAYGVPPGVNPAKKLPLAGLRKFASTPGFTCLYDNGPIRIYRTDLP